ncbi:uncharacterized protein LOC112090314 isoform X2 [Morus notabilis]|nr:uncharacterized protein LOC112090314 isoform X2 [Morus notabilis]
MTSCLLTLLLLLLFHLSFIPVFSSFPNTTLLLQDVLKEISVKQKWDLDAIKVSRLDLRKLRFGTSNRYEFRVGIGKTHLSAIFSDEVSSWNNFRNPTADLGSLLDEVRSFALLDTFKLEGPFELRVGDSNYSSLLLPMNRTHAGFNRILVGEGITIEVRGAQEVSAFQASDFSSTVNVSHEIGNGKTEFWPIRHSFCGVLVQIQVFGSAALAAYRTKNPDNCIKTKRISKETIELLAEKCYGNNIHKKRNCPVDSLGLRIAMLEKVLRSYFGERLNGTVGLFRGKISALALIRFQLELEMDSRSNDTQQAKASWRTRPSVERVWFDVLARVEAERLKLLVAKETNPSFVTDTAGWSNLSNISFTKFPSLLVPSEALTLDVK